MIYVNARFLTQEMTGVQRFATELCLQLSVLRRDVVFLSPDNIKMPDIADRLNVKVIGKNRGHFWEQFDLPLFLNTLGKPLLINLGNTAPLLYKNKLVTLHDISYLRFPQTYSLPFRLFYRFLMPSLLRNCRALLTVSDFSKQEICSEYKFPLERVFIIYNAVSKVFEARKEASLSKNYFLAVSSNHYHKNFHRLVEAFSMLSGRNDVHMIVVGGSNVNFNAWPQSAVNSPARNVRFVGRVSDEELVKLYSNALCFVFPSLYEGFGIPPLEAQACGCPVIASHAAAIPEVLGDSALYFDPLDKKALAAAMEKIIMNPELQTSLSLSGRVNVRRFSWLFSARQLIRVIDSI